MIRFAEYSLYATILLFVPLSPAVAATATGSMNVKMTITNECKTVTASDLDFGSSGVLDANKDATSTISLTCTNSTPFTIALDAGTGSGSTVTARKMTGPSSSTLAYQLFRDSSRTQNWGNTGGTDTVGGTGTGSQQNVTVYGRIAAQTTPAAGSYSDTITITVAY